MLQAGGIRSICSLAFRKCDALEGTVRQCQVANVQGKEHLKHYSSIFGRACLFDVFRKHLGFKRVASTEVQPRGILCMTLTQIKSQKLNHHFYHPYMRVRRAITSYVVPDSAPKNDRN